MFWILLIVPPQLKIAIYLLTGLFCANSFLPFFDWQHRRNQRKRTKFTWFALMAILSFIFKNLIIIHSVVPNCLLKKPREMLSKSHMSRALDGTEKSKAQKLGHPMLVQPILSQKNQKSKFFNEPFFCNWPICIFPYVKLEAKWRKNDT